MTIAVNIAIGLVAGGIVALLANKISKPATKVRSMITYGLGMIFGALGAQAADQLLDYGPTMLGSSLLPAVVGGIVLAFVVIYAGKQWLRLGR